MKVSARQISCCFFLAPMLARELFEQLLIAPVLDEHDRPIGQQRDDLHTVHGTQIFEQPELSGADVERDHCAFHADSDRAAGCGAQKLWRVRREDELRRFLAGQPFQDSHELSLQTSMEMSIRFVEQEDTGAGGEHRNQDLQCLMKSRARNHDVELAGEHTVSIGGVEKPVDLDIEVDLQDALGKQMTKEIHQLVPA